MKRNTKNISKGKIKKKWLGLSLVLCLLVFSISIQQAKTVAQQSRESAEEEFEILPDGTVRAGRLVFKNLSEYVESDYFKIMEKRCGTRFPHGQKEIYADTSDCTLSQTIIQNEYYSRSSPKNIKGRRE